MKTIFRVKNLSFFVVNIFWQAKKDLNFFFVIKRKGNKSDGVKTYSVPVLPVLQSSFFFAVSGNKFSAAARLQPFETLVCAPQ